MAEDLPDNDHRDEGKYTEDNADLLSQAARWEGFPRQPVLQRFDHDAIDIADHDHTDGRQNIGRCFRP